MLQGIPCNCKNAVICSVLSQYLEFSLEVLNKSLKFLEDQIKLVEECHANICKEKKGSNWHGVGFGIRDKPRRIKPHYCSWFESNYSSHYISTS